MPSAIEKHLFSNGCHYMKGLILCQIFFPAKGHKGEKWVYFDTLALGRFWHTLSGEEQG
jgi:hypothetical protein